MNVPIGTVIIETPVQLFADNQLKVSRCPHCGVHSPTFSRNGVWNSTNYQGSNPRSWHIYICSTCGGGLLAETKTNSRSIIKCYPEPETINDTLPSKVKSYLQQAIDSVFAPAGSVMLSASAVDAMLKDKGYTDGSLYKRIGEAVNKNLLTPEMATWAHQVRLDANDQRHVDENADLPTKEDAERLIEFVKTLAEIIYVLPAKVTRGLATSSNTSK